MHCYVCQWQLHGAREFKIARIVIKAKHAADPGLLATKYFPTFKRVEQTDTLNTNPHKSLPAEFETNESEWDRRSLSYQKYIVESKTELKQIICLRFLDLSKKYHGVVRRS